ADNIESALNAAAGLRSHFDRLSAAVTAVFDAADFLSRGGETRLFAGHSVMRAARDRVIHEMSLQPPSGT
ncbi:hypothetical protein NLM59_11805, partial [Weeksellaceae bacterium KMM 9724]